MTDEDLPAFTAALVAVADLFEADLHESRQLVYFQALRDLPWADVAQALSAAIRERRFMPKPVEIRELIEGDPEEQTEKAWLEYKHLARVVGGYASPHIADAALADALIAMFGSWELACWTDLTPEMWTAKRKEFGRVYRAMLKRGERTPKSLVGFIERENQLRGWKMSTEMIGISETSRSSQRRTDPT